MFWHTLATVMLSVCSGGERFLYGRTVCWHLQRVLSKAGYYVFRENDDEKMK